jgi:hypothetical protein
LSNSGTLTIDAGGHVDYSAPAPPYSAAAGAIANSGMLTFHTGYIGSHGISGAGTTIVEGVLATGIGSDPTAVLSVSGNLIVSSFLSARLASGGHDAVSVGGHLTLGGTLDVVLSGGFTPAVGDSFDLLDWPSGELSGAFSSIVVPALGAPKGWNLSALYKTGVISVTKFVPGDFDRDGVATAADVSAMMTALIDLDSYTMTNGLMPSDLTAIGDLDGDSAVTNADLQGVLVQLANYPVTTAGGGSISAVPEPSSLVLLAIGLVAASTIRRVRRS